MVATRGAREGTPGAPLVATGRRKKFWGPPLVAQRERASLPKSEAPALGTGTCPLLQCPCKGNSSSSSSSSSSSTITTTSTTSTTFSGTAAGMSPPKSTSELWTSITRNMALSTRISKVVKLAHIALVQVPGSVMEERLFSRLAYIRDERRNRLEEEH
eukprot:1136949-Pelagomonas_calceolata.AAC.16